MKKLLIALAFVGLSTASFAQEEPTLKNSVATNSFWSNWFIQEVYSGHLFMLQRNTVKDSQRARSRVSAQTRRLLWLLVSGSLQVWVSV